MTLLITSLTQERSRDMRSAAEEVLDAGLGVGCDGVEFRLDVLKDEEADIRGIAADLQTGRWIVTCRPAGEGGQFHGSIENRVERLLGAGPPGEGFIDFEYSDWKRSDLARNDLMKGNVVTGRFNHPPSLILSHHDHQGCPSDIDALVAEMCAVPEAAIVKIAWQARDIFDCFKALDLMRSGVKPVAAICMGEHGLLSRVLARKVNGFASYCSIASGEESAPGQVSLQEMLDRYRWHDMDRHTQLYGVIGDPVDHSLGPHLFNHVFNAEDIPGVYLPLRVPEGYDAFARFMDECLERDWLDLRGLSVTTPHKVNALRYLGDRVDPPADAIGAVNTIRFEEGELWGCNTDFGAALDTILEGMGRPEEEFSDLPVDVLGAGGVARAVVAGLLDLGCHVTVYNRDQQRGQSLADTFECEVKPWDERTNYQGQLLVNCTSVGMWPDIDETPMPAEFLREGVAVFDAVYRPRETRLLRDASEKGCRTIDGVGMFLRQAVQQFEYWTQQSANVGLMAKMILQSIGEEVAEEEDDE